MKGKLFLGAACAAMLTAGPASADTIELTGVVRDFLISHPDMQYPDKSFGVRTGLVMPQLGADAKPVLNTSANYHNGMIAGPESFDQWFRDVPGVNITMPLTITMDNDQEGEGGIYTYAVEKPTYFFPIDGRGWNDSQTVSTGTHNFYFTYEIVTEFTYTDPATREDELVFSFTGDDDVWVFINGHLVVDLGGVHGQANGSVNVDDMAAELGLEPGNNYALNFFFAERHTTESNFRIETSLQLIATPTTISPVYD